MFSSLVRLVIKSGKGPLTPTDAVVELEGRGRIEDVGHYPRMEVGALDEHPENGSHLPVHQDNQNEFA